LIRAAFGLLLALLLAGLIAVLWLLCTTDGARWLAARAEAELPGLEVTVERGSLWEGLGLREVAWQGEGLEVRAARLGFAWRPLCLLDARVCVDQVASEGLRVAVTAAGEDPGAAEAADGPGRLSLPVTVLLRELDLRDTRVSTPAAEVALTRLRSSASLAGDRLRVGETRLAGLSVTLPEAAPEAPAAAEDDAAKPLSLPEVRLPLDIDLAGVVLVEGALQRAAERWSLERLELAGAFADGALELERLEVTAPQGSASLAGRLALRGDWPLDLRLQARAPGLAAGEDLALRARLQQSVAELAVELELSAPASARVEAQVQPLAATPAWAAQVSAERLQWPLAGDPQVVAEGLRLDASGTLADYEVDAEVAIEGPDLPGGRYRLALRGDAGGAEIVGLDGRLLGGRIGVAGDVGWADGVRWDLALALGDLDPGQWRADLDGRLGGQLRVRGEVADGGWSLAAELPGIAGSLRGYPFSLTGAVAGGSRGEWRFDALELVSGGNRATLEGALAERWDARLTLAAPRLDRLWPGLAGALRGDVQLGGPAAAPDVALDLRARGLAYQELAIESVRLEGAVRERFEAASRLALDIEGASRAGESLGMLQARLEGRRSGHRLRVEATGGPVPAAVTVQGGLSAALDAWEGRLASARLRSPEGEWRLERAAGLAWRAGDNRVTLAGHCWVRRPGRLCLTEPLQASPAGAGLRLALEDYPLAAVDPWLPPELGIDGSLAGQAALDWEPGALPVVDLTLESAEGALLLEGLEADEPVRFGWQRIRFGAELGATQARVNLALESEAFGSGSLQARIDPGAAPRSLAGEVRLAGVELAPLGAFLPQLRDLDGRLAADGRLAGTVAAPNFDGEVRLEDGRVVLQALASPLEEVALTARIQGAEAQLSGGFRAGEGEARLEGELAWSDGLRGALRLTGEGLEIRDQSLARVRVTPDLQVDLSPEAISVTGDIAVPWARIRIRELPAGAVRVSDDVVIVGDEDADGDGNEDPAPAPVAEEGMALSTDIRVTLGDDVAFEGFGAEGRLEGSLRLRQVGAGDTEAEGEIRFEDGRFSAYGQRLEIRRGRFLFAGPIGEPQLDIEAIRRVQEVTAGLRVSGSASDPQVTLFSEPAMPQADTLAYLITGRPPGGGTPSQEALVAQAALSLGVFGGRNVGGALAEELGVEDFQLETSGQGEESEVAVSGYIAPNLLVRYGVGVFQPQNTLTLRYDLTERLFVEAVSGAESALDIFYSFDF